MSDRPQIGIPDPIQEPIENALGTKKGYWYVSYSFHQNFWQDSSDPKKAWGVFGEVALSDGNPNPFLGHWYVGVGGNSVLLGRRDDLWGVAYFDYRFSQDFRGAVDDVLGIQLESERGLEAYYNLAVTPWFRLTGNVEVVDPALGSRDTAVFFGLRSQVRF